MADSSFSPHHCSLYISIEKLKAKCIFDHRMDKKRCFLSYIAQLQIAIMSCVQNTTATSESSRPFPILLPLHLCAIYSGFFEEHQSKKAEGI